MFCDAFVYKFIKSLAIVTNFFIASLIIKQVVRKVLFLHCSIEPYLVIANKHNLLIAKEKRPEWV